MNHSGSDILRTAFRTEALTVPRERGRSLYALLWTIAITILACTVVFVALTASAFSLYMSFNELSRRSESAIQSLVPQLTHALDDAKDVQDAAAALNDMAIDPDVTGAAIVDQQGRELAIFANTKPKDFNLTIADHQIDVSWSLTTVTARAVVSTANGPTVLSLTYRTTAALHRAGRQFILFLVAGFAGLLFVGLILRMLLTRQLKPWRELVAAMSALVDLDYGRPVAGLDRRGELGDMARALETFRSKLIDRERLRHQTDTAHVDLAQQHRQIDAKVDEFRAGISAVLHEVGGVSEQMTVAADGLKAIATQSNKRANDASGAIEETSSNVGIVAEASEDLSAAIHEIERQVEQTRAKVSDATRCTADTGRVMQGLFAKAEQIGEIIELIQSIAAQTNLLSLNATIEAARAGEAGRGFAVVAQEVKSLADQTTRASQHVADHILAIQAATSQAAAAIATIDSTMGEAEKFSSIISIAVERQASATAEISRSAADAARSAQAAAGSMKRLAAAVGETEQSAAQVHQSAGDVGRQAADLNATVDRFLRDTATIRGAA